MDEERSDEINSVIRKGLVLLVALAVVVALGTYVMVRAFGLNSGGGTATPSLDTPPHPTVLPTTALPVPSKGSSSSASSPSSTPTKKAGRSRALYLSVSPLEVAPMQRINITGMYAHHDNISLQVQRLENGIWADFPTQAQVSMGTFGTYVMTGRPGPNRFRVFDPSTGKASNVVVVMVK